MFRYLPLISAAMDERFDLSQLMGRFSDPVRVSGPATIVGLGLAVLSSLSLALLDGGAQALALGICWLLIVPASLLRGWGMAFFLEHGRGRRRALVELVVGALVALVACAFLSFRSGTATGTVYMIIFGLALYVAVFGSLAAGVGIGLGRGGDYMARKIQEVDDESW